MLMPAFVFLATSTVMADVSFTLAQLGVVLAIERLVAAPPGRDTTRGVAAAAAITVATLLLRAGRCGRDYRGGGLCRKPEGTAPGGVIRHPDRRGLCALVDLFSRSPPQRRRARRARRLLDIPIQRALEDASRRRTELGFRDRRRAAGARRIQPVEHLRPRPRRDDVAGRVSRTRARADKRPSTCPAKRISAPGAWAAVRRSGGWGRCSALWR